MKRLGCLIIGDEILAGHVHESNSHWLAKELKPLGIRLARVEVCTDDLPDIEASVRRFLHDLDLDYVVTSGGLGPTPDDRTMEGLARALGVSLGADPEHLAWIRERVAEGHRRGYFDSPEPNAGVLKMAELPEGSRAMPNALGTALGAIVDTQAEPSGRPVRLFTLPGVPREFERMFHEGVKPFMETGRPDHVEELVLYSEESRFFPVLARLEREHPSVMIGSYPQRGHILLRATGPEADAQAVIEALREAGQAFLEPRARPRG